MLKAIEEAKNNPENILELNQRIEKIGKPYSISNWWISRHEMLSHG